MASVDPVALTADALQAFADVVARHMTALRDDLARFTPAAQSSAARWPQVWQDKEGNKVTVTPCSDEDLNPGHLHVASEGEMCLSPESAAAVIAVLRYASRQ